MVAGVSMARVLIILLVDVKAKMINSSIYKKIYQIDLQNWINRNFSPTDFDIVLNFKFLHPFWRISG